MATSAWKICLMNLFLDEWTSWMMSVWRLSRFFSRKPGRRTERKASKIRWSLGPGPQTVGPGTDQAGCIISMFK